MTQPSGRARQATTLDFVVGGGNGAAGLTALLNRWGAATPGLGPFNTPALTGGEQIGIDGVLRFDTGGSGLLAIGDFALRYDSSATIGQGLVLTQDLSFNSVTFYVDVDESSFVSSAEGFSFDASLTSEPFNGGFVGLDPNAGSLSINALTATAVPEPSTTAVLALGAMGLAWRWRRQPTVIAS